MSGARKYVSMGLVLLVCTLTGHCGEGAPSAAAQSSSSSSRDAQSDWRRMVEIMRHAENAHGRHGSRTDAPTTSRARGSTAEPRNQRTEKSVVVFPRDLRKKEKFLKHMTGPLYFAPQCRKLVYRLYHHTRDCSQPQYYKRCARLLTRLAGSPQCTEG